MHCAQIIQSLFEWQNYTNATQPHSERAIERERGISIIITFISSIKLSGSAIFHFLSQGHI